MNKGIEFIDLPGVFWDGSVASSIPTYFQNSGPPIICNKYNKPIRDAVFGFGRLVSDLVVHAGTPESWDCGDSRFVFPAAGRVVAVSLGVISDSGVRCMVSKGPRCGFPSRIDFGKCGEEVASAFGDFGGRWCGRKYVEPGAVKEWRVDVFEVVGRRVEFYFQNTNLLPSRPESAFRRLGRGVRGYRRKYVLVPADKAAANVVVV